MVLKLNLLTVPKLQGQVISCKPETEILFAVGKLNNKLNYLKMYDQQLLLTVSNYILIVC